MSGSWFSLMQRRRTQYALGRGGNRPQTEVSNVIRSAIRHAPSAFNSQSSRAVILWGAQSERLWDLVGQELASQVSEAAATAAAPKLASFAAGLGTILFFEDRSTVDGLQAKFPLYADNFPVWSEQSGGMAQFAVWVALGEIGLGAPARADALRLERSAVGRQGLHRRRWPIPRVRLT